VVSRLAAFDRPTEEKARTAPHPDIMSQHTHNSSIDLEKQNGRVETDNGASESPDMSIASTAQLKLAAESPVAKAELDSLSRIESATSVAFDPASRVPTNASRESGIIGMYPPFALLWLADSVRICN